jgi:hypothetical protein
VDRDQFQTVGEPMYAVQIDEAHFFATNP